MKFQLKSILSEIKELYTQPISTDRFQAYMSKLQGDSKGDMSLPISGFNPMAKDHILDKIGELEDLDTEAIMYETIEEYNSQLSISNSENFVVVLNIADDLKGGWTNYYSTDFDSKFKLNAFVQRRFCLPYFWTSEIYSKEIIKSRTWEYLSRSIYRLNHTQPKTLEDHFKQELFVAKSIKQNNANHFPDDSFIIQFYSDHLNSQEYDKIFNFFYGDEGSLSLGYKTYGNTKFSGFNLAKRWANKGKDY